LFPYTTLFRSVLRLERRHVDADRTVVRAALAREAEVEGFVDLLRVPLLELASVQHLPEQVGAAARRVLLLARNHEARAHDAALGVTALADADAPGRPVRE